MTRTHLILVTLFSALALTGCGSNGTPEAEPSTNAADMGVKFAQCMREHGVDMEDPVDGKITIKTTKGSQAKTEAAQQACKQFAPKREGNADDPEARDLELKMAACLRKNGVDVKDPQPGQGIRITGGPGDAGKLEKAQKACDKELGNNVSGG